ncbi:AbiJ-NTD4 domain-containing protein, partial [Variovorax boronicumulans]|uniref:AbiJ-NTD4 domain-containing protein n=1 Tax=Variovorax boronicumulans TaxID=436515 RepID=UPI002794F908|nr:hypothetical protein [Variovorax boronicumulans]
MDRFSSRHGYGRPDSEITIRHEAPQELREAIIRVAYQCGFKPNDLRKKLCALMYKAPDPNNWSDPNVDREVHKLFEELEWFEVYDIVEILVQSPCYSELSLEDELNRCFRRMGVSASAIEISRGCGGNLGLPLEVVHVFIRRQNSSGRAVHQAR